MPGGPMMPVCFRAMGAARQNRLLDAAMAASLAFLLGIGWLVYTEIRAASAVERLAVQSFVMIQNLDRLLSSLKDAETGQRGYLLSGDERYLEPYRAGVADTERYLTSLKQSALGDRSQQQRLAAIQALIGEKFVELGQTIELRRGRGLRAALAVVATDRGKATMDRIRVLVAESQAVEQQLLARRDAEKAASTGKTLKVLLAGGILDLLLLTAVFLFLKEENRRRLTAETEVARHRDRLQELVAERTGALAESEEQFRTLADSIPNLAWWADGDGYITWYNRRWYEYTGTTAEQMEGWGWQSVHDPEALPLVLERWRESIATGRPFDMTFPLRGADGVFRPFLTRVMPVHGEDGRIARWFGTNTDVSEAKETEAKLENLARQRQFALDAAHVGWWHYDPVTRVANWDDRYREIFGVPGYQLPNDEILTKIIDPEDLPGLWKQVERALDPVDPRPFEAEYRIRRPDGALRWVEAYGMASFEERDGRRLATSFVGTVADITERKQADERVRASLHEKEVLLKEIHHRVKNNLQVISSLVSLQAGSSRDETIREVLGEVSSRVRSMALVHEKLYQSSDLAHIDFADYLRSLVAFIWRAHGSGASRIGLKLELEPVAFPVDTAVPCGLMVNELAGNALKHAFTGREDGEVTVTLKKGADGSVRLVVADNGHGLPAGLNWREANSLGLKLVQMLAGQLDAGIEVVTGQGTRFAFSINAQSHLPAGPSTSPLPGEE